MKMIDLTCPDCKATLSVDEEHMLTKCPYCGCTKMISEDKEVTLKRLDIRSKKLDMEENEREREEINNAWTRMLIVVVVMSLFSALLLKILF